MFIEFYGFYRDFLWKLIGEHIPLQFLVVGHFLFRFFSMFPKTAFKLSHCNTDFFPTISTKFYTIHFFYSCGYTPFVNCTFSWKLLFLISHDFFTIPYPPPGRARRRVPSPTLRILLTATSSCRRLTKSC